MYRDFLYLDVERLQSIIAQLEKGLLDSILEGRTSEIEGKASVTAGVLASFLPFDIEGGVNRKHDFQYTKVLHDYVFNIAFEALQKNGFILEVTEEWNREDFLLPDGTFLLLKGSLSIIDYGLIKNLAENETALNSLFKPRQSASQGKNQGGKLERNKNTKKSGVFQEMKTIVEAFMGESIHVQISVSDQLPFVGPVAREFFRENTRDLIFKYGGKPREGWTMMAQLNQVTTPFSKLASLTTHLNSMPNFTDMDFSTISEALNPLVEVLNLFQEAIASVNYPAISVTPIALYREIESVK